MCQFGCWHQTATYTALAGWKHILSNKHYNYCMYCALTLHPTS